MGTGTAWPTIGVTLLCELNFLAQGYAAQNARALLREARKMMIGRMMLENSLAEARGWSFV